MTANDMMAEIRDANLSYLMLAQQMIRKDKPCAIFRLGISADIAAQLFQPFVTTKPQGMGVGLSISRTIIEAHGGQIWTEPNPGGGAIFKFTLRALSKEDIGDGASQ